ncbi:MAG: prepilin-type N-terminal cleavage/methylation domain-containing protein [Staphylococcus sp.]|jgi:prepilin-type cleavage/methylation N-terminal domain protein|nr:prepilin-type N-terminal cleavage/methylation domain-containing protein [Staphylococcus sp.]
MKKYLNNKGYTLIELVVSIAIIAILLSMIAVITNSFYKSYRLSYAENERLEEKKYIITQFENIIENANQNAKKVIIENDISLTKWSLRLDNEIIFSYDQTSSSMYNANDSLIKKFKRIKNIKINQYTQSGIIIEIYLDNNEKETLIKNIINVN